MVAAIAAIFGLAVGSFLNVVIYRLPHGESIAYPASHCPRCGHPLSAADNVPVVSWLVLAGRCRYCKQPISLRYPVVEMLTAAAFAFYALRYGLSLELVAYCALAAVLLAVFFIDLDHLLIPDSANAALAVVGLGTALLQRSLLGALEGAAIGLALFGAIYAATRGAGMGLGDVKLAGALGLFLGFPASLAAFVASFVIGTILTLPVLFMKKRGRRDALPFGPFIAIAALLTASAPALVYGPYDAYRALLAAHFMGR